MKNVADSIFSNARLPISPSPNFVIVMVGGEGLEPPMYVLLMQTK
jgi:hypothetical protein